MAFAATTQNIAETTPPDHSPVLTNRIAGNGTPAPAMPDIQGLLASPQFGAHHQSLVGVGCRLLYDYELARDVVQDAYAKALDPKTLFKGDSSIKTFLYRVVINRCIDIRRRHARWRAIQEALSFEWAFVHRSIEDRMDDQSAVQLLFSRIPDTYRAPFILAEADGMSYEEIAETLDISLNAVRTRIFRCREKLRKELRKTRRLS
jgi:RNA polymerase sigma-70 factor, ECF subfamily